mmetsp:Transcript_34477/g.83644  ORF Transcript_34477/g.83644 Transcript_34477/m.83644 type:complete len:915 (+) Transcript_34477:267-3011(+)|eukprot:CAMPEP_0113611824 /NCGR_PEP_ID=MMETSP0017_2-20120614/5773_1 /TAXON_ID=2856 /ORGANISM="Cylindrotheca closterium" /LENGTH=914 /DNA_ID=CAMNT_0000520819 /DNA_START=147 /DNA_END=2891 /DNA_ORIENTATION=- /assembly_acc=CAM_ASM_000147
MGNLEEETKHEAVSRSQQQQPLTQQQVLQHLSTLQKRMGQMQSFAKGLSDQAQQDKIKIQTLEQQLEAAKTLQWAKQRASPRTERRKQMGETIPENPPKAGLPPISTPRLEQIRKARQEREEKLRFQFSHSSEVNDLAKAEQEHTHDLEEKLHDLEAKYENLQTATHNVESEKANLLLEHTELLAEKQAVIHKLEEEMKALEELIEESYHDRESLEKKLIKTANKNNALDLQLESMEAISDELKRRDVELTLKLMEAQETEDELLSNQINDSLEALVGQEEQDQLIRQLESMVQSLEHQAEKASRHQPEEHGNQMQRESDWGKDVLSLHRKVEALKKQLKDQEDHFHKDTIEMEVELMDAQEFARMQRDMLEAQEMELLLLSNALADLEKDHPLARSLSGGDLFAIREDESEVDKSREEEDENANEQKPVKHVLVPPPPPLLDESPVVQQQSKEAKALKKEQDEKELQERIKKAHLHTLHCNIYLLSRKFEWQLQRREELELQMGKANKKFDALVTKYAKKEEKLKKQKTSEESQTSKNNAAGQNDDDEADENKESLTRALMRASMSIRGLQQELKTSKQRTTQLESELQKLAPTMEEKEDKQSDSSVADFKSQLEEQTETNELLKEFMAHMQDTHGKEQEEWKSQQQELNQKIEQLNQELGRKSGSTEDSSAPSPPNDGSPSPRSAMDRFETSTPAKSAQDASTIIASPPKTPLRTEWMTEISVVRSEISRLKRTLQSKQPQNESFLGVLNESGSQQSDDYIFADRSDDDINNGDVMNGGSNNVSAKWYQEVTALKEELNDLTVELRKSHHHENKVAAAPTSANWKKAPPNPVQTGPVLDDTSSVDSSTTGGFENEILLLREEVDRQQEQRKTTVSPYSAISSAGSTSPNGRSSLVSSLEDSSFSEYNAFSEI